MNFADIGKYLFGAGHQVHEDLNPDLNNGVFSRSYYQQTDPNILQRIVSAITGKPPELRGTPSVPSNFNEIISATAQPNSGSQPINPSPSPTIGPPSFGPQSTPRPAPLDLNTITKMINVYGGENAPLHNYSGQLSEAMQYDFWKNNPELLALIPHLETTSGRYMTRPKDKPNNILNYGINDPNISALFENMSPEEVLQRSLKEIGETGNTYKSFRTGKPLSDEELQAFANIYEPANPDYGPNLINGRMHIRNTLGL